VHDAVLHQSLRVDRIDRFRETLQPGHNGNQDVIDVARLELVDDPQPELGAFRLVDPESEHVLLAVAVVGERDVDSFVLDKSLVAGFWPARRKTRSGRGVERPALPFPDLFEDGISHPADPVG
jgi:hypothetical protein